MKKLFCRWLLIISILIIAPFACSTVFVLSQFKGNTEFPVECAVVFGSAVRGNEFAGPGIKRRVETAVHLYKEGSIEHLFFTGGLGEGNKLSEASVMKNVALESGVDSNFITTEEGAESTWQNVKFVQPLVSGCEDIVAISDRYHLARIRLTAFKQNLDVSIHPADKIADRYFESRAVIREALASLLYLVLVD